MRVRFWGVRGSLPVPGPKTERYGGNTSCVEVVSAAGTRVIIDAGSGLRKLGKEIMRAEPGGGSSAHVLISHTHWDHIQGLPFFGPLYQKGNELHVYARRQESVGTHMRAVLAAQTGPPYFPVPFEEARAAVTVRELEDRAHFQISDVTVTCARLNHPYIATAYGLSVDGAKVAYVSDTAPFSDILFGHELAAKPPQLGGQGLSKQARETLRAMRADVVRLCEGADLVIYDTMYTPEDYAQMPHFGHSRPADALEIGKDAGARTVALFHHAPERSDAEVDDMLADARALASREAKDVEVVAAFEGMDLQLGAR